MYFVCVNKARIEEGCNLIQLLKGTGNWYSQKKLISYHLKRFVFLGQEGHLALKCKVHHTNTVVLYLGSIWVLSAHI